MNKEYIKGIFEKNKKIFKNSEIEINSVEDLESQIISYVISNLQYDFNIDIDQDKLFNSDYEIELDDNDLEK